jgi:hypothetical protein
LDALMLVEEGVTLTIFDDHSLFDRIIC